MSVQNIPRTKKELIVWWLRRGGYTDRQVARLATSSVSFVGKVRMACGMPPVPARQEERPEPYAVTMRRYLASGNPCIDRERRASRGRQARSSD